MNADYIQTLLAKLGIDPNYGLDPALPRYPEATDLVDAGMNFLGRPQRLERTTATTWETMRDAAAGDGIELLLISGFRSYRDQVAIFERKIERGQSVEEVLQVNAAPGFSQHHTGRALDLASPGAPPLTAAFESTPAFQWLTGNADGFGFSMPYGRDNAHGFTFEPWHWARL